MAAAAGGGGARGRRSSSSRRYPTGHAWSKLWAPDRRPQCDSPLGASSWRHAGRRLERLAPAQLSLLHGVIPYRRRASRAWAAALPPCRAVPCRGVRQPLPSNSRTAGRCVEGMMALAHCSPPVRCKSSFGRLVQPWGTCSLAVVTQNSQHTSGMHLLAVTNTFFPDHAASSDMRAACQHARRSRSTACAATACTDACCGRSLAASWASSSADCSCSCCSSSAARASSS